jgi:ribosomal protein S18 acetylase RimI-like enzyme
MADMLVKLYELPEMHAYLVRMDAIDVEIRRAQQTEEGVIANWIREHFSEGWALETTAAVRRRPASCFIAVEKQAPDPERENRYEQPPELLLGFGCYDVVALGMFGPTGVRMDYRAQGIGSALLLACLHAMRDEGYAYAQIGWAGPTTFYEKIVGATIIEGSEPGIYRGKLVGTEE